MPFEITFANLPVGINVEAAPRGATTAIVQAIGFASAEDGDVLIRQLEGFGSDILGMLPHPVPPGDVNHLLAIIRRDCRATIYLNEARAIGEVQPKRAFAKGAPVFADDLVDIHRLAFDGVSLPKDAGIIYIFCVGWRRAMFFDLLPLNPLTPVERDYDLEVQLARYYSYLLFQERFKITSAEWDALFAGQWFPFVTLSTATIRSLLGHASNGWLLDDLAEAIAAEVKSQVPNLLGRWRSVATFRTHLPFLEQAAERYLADDFISTTAILYPRIEGLMRSHQRHADPGAPATQKGLAGSAVRSVTAGRHEASLLLPAKVPTVHRGRLLRRIRSRRSQDQGIAEQRRSRRSRRRGVLGEVGHRQHPPHGPVGPLLLRPAAGNRHALNRADDESTEIGRAA